MSEQKHTPGPWQVGWCGSGDDPKDRHYMILRRYAITIDSENRIASISGGSDNTEADANLIAAAPDLLEACTLAEAIVSEAFGRDPDKLAEEHPALAAILRLLRPAIAKAEGR